MEEGGGSRGEERTSSEEGEEGCTWQGAAWRGLDQSQEKGASWSSCKSKGSACQRATVPYSTLAMAPLALGASPMACMPSALPLTRCISTAHCNLHNLQALAAPPRKPHLPLSLSPPPSHLILNSSSYLSHSLSSNSIQFCSVLFFFGICLQCVTQYCLAL